jgi:hypothetical protein
MRLFFATILLASIALSACDTAESTSEPDESALFADAWAIGQTLSANIYNDLPQGTPRSQEAYAEAIQAQIDALSPADKQILADYVATLDAPASNGESRAEAILLDARKYGSVGVNQSVSANLSVPCASEALRLTAATILAGAACTSGPHLLCIAAVANHISSIIEFGDCLEANGV